MTGSGLILHDHFIAMGGAERTALAMTRSFPVADLWTGAWGDEVAAPAPDVASRLRIFGSPIHSPVWRLLSGMRTFGAKTENIEKYDWAIYSGIAAPMAVHRRRGLINILYCHHPPRFACDLHNFYLGSIPAWQRPIFCAAASYVRSRYASALGAMDVVIANSKTTSARLQEFFSCPSQVVYPPCDTKSFKWLGLGDYFLSTARLEPYKRVDRIIDAFREMPERRLVVTSGGSDEERLRQLASGAANITFTGWVDDAEVRTLVGNAIATIYLPMGEDFGISPVESMAAGKPVIGVAEGGVEETVVHGETGYLMPSEFAKKDLQDAVENIIPGQAVGMKEACIERASLFGTITFIDKINSVVQNSIVRP